MTVIVHFQNLSESAHKIIHMIGGQKFLQNHFNILFQYSEDHGRRYTDQYAGCDPAEKEHREVEEDPQIFYESGSYEELTEIV